MLQFKLLLFLFILCTAGTTTTLEIKNNEHFKNDPPKTRGLLFPIESETREKRSLDGMWGFLTSKANESFTAEDYYTTDLDKIDGRIGMPVPASYNDMTTDATLRDHVGAVWYQRKFFASHDWSLDKRVFLRFGSVHYSAIVWLNDIKITSHSIGHLPFEVEISVHLKYGAENRLTVLCNNTLTPSTIPQGYLDKLVTDTGNKTFQKYTFDFFNYAGIHRSVVLYTTPKVYIQDIMIQTDVKLSEPDIYETELFIGFINYTIKISGYESNEVQDDDEVEDISSDGLYYLHLQLRDKAGHIVAQQKCKGIPFNGSLIVEDVNLWWPYLMHPDYAYLYELEVYLHSTADNNSVLDVYRMNVGIRKVDWDNMNLRINGQEVYLHGFGRHEDSDLRGKGLDFVLLARDFNLIKWIGANTYRTSHYPYSEESMQFADENGIMIIDECSSVNTDIFGADLMYNHKSALEQLIHRDRNHASVIMWSIANEPRTANNKSEPYFREIVRYVKTLDNTRPFTASINVKIGQDKMAQFLDIISFNRYNAWYAHAGHLDMIINAVRDEATSWWHKYNRPVLMSEYGADTMEGLHALPEFLWSEEYQVQLLDKHFKAFDYLREEKWFIGEFVWNFADFKTEQTATRVGENRKGLFTRNRQPKAAAHILRKRYFSLCNEFYECEIPNDLLF